MSTSKRINLFLLFGFLIGSALILAVFFYLRNDQEEHIRTHAREKSENVFHNIRREIALTTQSLYEIKDLYESSEFVSRDEFRHIARSILSRRSGIQALEWIPRVRGEERAAYEARARRDGFPDFHFTKHQGRGEMVPQDEREGYFPVYYMEPYKGNETTLGFDLASDADGLKAIEKAQKTGQPTAVEAIIPVQENVKWKGCLIFLPVYRNGESNDANFMGFALGVFRIGDLLEATWPDLTRSSELETHLYDITDSKDVPLFQNSLPGRAVASSSFDHSAVLEVADRQWQLQIHPTKAFIERHRLPYPYWFLGSSLATLLLLLYAAINKTRQFETLAKLHTSLSEAEKIGHMGHFTITFPERQMWMSGEMLDAYNLDESMLPVPMEWAFQRIHPEDQTGIEEALEGLLADGEPRSMEIRIRTNEQEEKLIRILGKIERNPDGTPLRIIAITRDVTEEREKEKALRFNEAYLRVIFDTEPDILITTSGDTIDRANARMLEFTGYPDIESFKKDHKCICDLFEKREGYLQRDMQGLNWLEYVYVHPEKLHKAIITKEGKEHTFLISANPLGLDDKKRNIVVLSNITQLEAANKAVRESTRKFRDLVESINDWMWEVDAQGRYTYVSPRCREMLGYEPEEILGKSPFDLMPPDEAEKIAEQFGAIAGQKAPIKNLLNRNLHKSGREVVMETSGIPLLDAKGNLTGYRGVDRDVTERILAEETLKEEQTRAELYLHTAQVMLVALDREGTITMINPRGCDILGASEEELLGKSWFECCIPPEIGDEMQGIFAQCLKEREEPVREYDNEILRQDGTRRLIHWRNAQLKDASGKIIGILSSGEDVTERRKTEAQLTLFRTLLDNSNDAIEILDPGTLRYLDINEAACSSLGYSREEMLGMSVYDIDPDFTPELAQTMQEQMRESGSNTSFEGIHRRRDGSTFPVEISATMIELDKPYVLSIARDITERKAAEAALEASELRFKAIFDNADDGILLADTETKTFITGNHRICQMLGYTPEELNSLWVTDIHPQKDLSYVLGQFERQVKGEIKLATDLPVLRKDGSVFYADVNSFPLTIGGKEYLAGFFRDVTERRESETILHRFREVIDHSLDAIFLIDKNGMFIDVNEEACRSLGYERDVLLTMGVLDIAPDRPDEAPLSELIPMIMEKRSATFESRHIRKDGSEFPVEVSVGVEKSDEEEMMIAVARDITERKAMEAELQQKEEMMLAQSRQAAMGDMIAMIAHQWRQPITVISMAANNVKLAVELGEEVTNDKLAKMSDTVTEQTKHLSKTIDDFRNFFKPNKQKERSTVGAVIDGAMQIIGKSLENNDIAVDINDNSKSSLHTYPNELLQVFLNLLGNAKDVLKGRENARITIRVRERDDTIVTDICDNGGGIPEAIISRIGEPYFTTKKKSGTGLGIYMSKTIVERHLDGTLTWRNEADGACFSVTLPKTEPTKETP